ncbi:AraC family transcriptional regulator [Bradyrhizobium lupini HPC(L)]|uniref:AraC family transcriptional regulator n=1 Tax=Bradyrhizobium lupini HPC(L) TaxID=1229491 RepID=A0ABP2RRZ3_RHILU|nr:AraC family transcriptional regulator [Bradyrhizobium lupini HPC(L)]
MKWGFALNQPAYSSFAHWYSEGRLANYVRSMKSAGAILNLLEAAQPAGDMSDPAVPDLVLYQDLLGGTRVSGDLGAGQFDVVSQAGGFFLAAPDFANTVIVEKEHQLRSLSFPVIRWQSILDEGAGGAFSFDSLVHKGTFTSSRIRSTILHLWQLCDEEGAPSRLLAQAAGCEILAELCRLTGSPMQNVRGGLPSWSERRTVELLRTRLADDISLEDLAKEAGLSTFHFSRMFKRSFGVPPRAYLAQVRVEKACELLEHSDLPVTDIALEVGYSSSQVLARVFMRLKRLSPSEYRKAVRG